MRQVTVPAAFAFLLLGVAACRPSRGAARAGSADESSRANGTLGLAGSVGAGRWVMWAAPGRTSGRFVTAEGPGPEWSLSVSGRGRWSNDGRWLTSCSSELVAARWMGSTRPSRVAVLNGGCESLEWGPQGNVALSVSKSSKRARILSFTAGAQPGIRETSFEIALKNEETLHASEYLEWSPAGDGFLVSVWGARHSWIRWVDAAASPGTVGRLLTPEGFEALGQCWWAPGGKRAACLASMPPASADAPLGPRRALALFDIQAGKVAGRLLFEAPWFALDKLSWLDAERLVFRDRDATRVLNVSGVEPPLVLSATAGDFAVSPTAPQVAYVNHNGLCLRTAGSALGPERLLAPGSRLQGVHWSGSGRHLYTHRTDLRAVVVVTDATTEKPRVHHTPEARTGFTLGAEFSAGGNLLLARATQPNRFDAPLEPLQTWSLPAFVPQRLLPEGFSERWFNLSPDDAALVAVPEGKLASLHLALSGGTRTKVLPLGKGSDDPWARWQPGSLIAATQAPAPPQPSDPRRQRVTLAASDPLTLGTAYVVGSRECSGALIDPYFVVTAHHCVEKADRPIRVVLGRGLSWEQEHAIKPYRIIHHPKVRHVEQLDLFENDLAVIELPEPARAPARPFALAGADEGKQPGEIYLAGYGGDWSVGLSAQAELRYGISQLVAPPAGIGGTVAWRSPEGAENAGCFGDSGGPALVRRGDGSFALLAIHFGTGGTDYTKACGHDGVGGNLAAERAWLNDSLDKLTLGRRGSGPPRRRANPF